MKDGEVKGILKKLDEGGKTEYYGKWRLYGLVKQTKNREIMGQRFLTHPPYKELERLEGKPIKLQIEHSRGVWRFKKGTAIKTRI